MDSISQSSLKKYRKLKTPEGNFDFDDPSTTSLNHSTVGDVKEHRIGRLNPEKAVWILIGCAVAYYTNLHYFLLPRNWPVKSWKIALWLSYASFLCFVSIFVYLNYYLRYVQGTKITAKHWKRDAPMAVPAATISGTLTFLFLSIGFFPHFHLWSFLIFSTISMSFFALISLL